MSEERGACVYRFFDAEDRLLYVGCTVNLQKRKQEHDRDKPWFSDVARTETVHFPTWAAARQAEAQAIQEERPVYNRMGTGALRPRLPISSYDWLSYKDVAMAADCAIGTISDAVKRGYLKAVSAGDRNWLPASEAARFIGIWQQLRTVEDAKKAAQAREVQS